ncbi:MAG: secretin N-terminal domain-containing protein, partial [Planctomycetota bacterium]
MRLACFRFLPALLTLVITATAIGGVPDTAVDGPDDPIRIRFNFKGASFDEVLDFFSRVTELPVVKETDVPEGTLDYLSPEAYELPEAMRVLNIILQARGVMLRLDDEMLYLQKLDQMQRENLPLYVGSIPETVTSDQVVTAVVPLRIAQAAPLAERLGSMIAAYGSVAAMEQQNSLIITETAGQIRRLLQIIEQLDQEDPEGAIEIYHIENTRAAKLMGPLKALLSVKMQKIVVDAKGKRTTIDEDSMPGISSMTHDDRTNSIIAKGVQQRLDKLAETIEILDVPATTGARAMRTVMLATLSPAQAETQLTKLYAKVAEELRPTVIGHAEQGSVTIVGDDQDIAEGIQLLAEIDGGGEGLTNDRTMSVFVLEHVEPAGIITALQTLLNDRQRVSTRLVAGPDGASIIASGPTQDVFTVRSVIEVLDRPGEIERRVRLVRLTASDPTVLLARAESLYAQEANAEDPADAISVDLDAASRTLTLIGAEPALDRFASVLRLVETNAVIARETRQVTVANTTPSAIVAPLKMLARQLLAGDGTQPYNEPLIEAVDALGVLLISAEPTQFAVLDSGVATLDRPGPGDLQFRVMSMTGVASPPSVIARADEIFQSLRVGARPEPARPEVEFDELTGSLILRGRSTGVRLYEQAVSQARQLVPPARTGRLLAVEQARVEEVIEPLRELLARTTPVDPGRTVPPATIEAITQTNSLYVVGEPAQHDVIAKYLRELDRFEPATLPPLRLIQVRAADAMALSTLLRQRYDGRPAEQRRDAPVDVSADAGTNTLIVVAHETVFDEIRTFVDEVNKSGETMADRETMLFPLKRARAVDVASALEKLYPEPPMPLDRRGNAMPHLREPRDVHVSADSATNTLIVEAPTERKASFEALVLQLDRVELPPSAELRTYHIERGDPEAIARTLSDLARQGIMSATPDDGSKPVEVTIQAEPQSRTLIVAGDEVTFAKTESVLRDLQAVPVPRSLRVFDVTGADPAELASQAERLYAEQTAEIPDAGDVAVEVDPENATILVVADDEAMMRFGSILTELRDAIGPPATIRLLPLQYADAAEVVRFVEDLIGSDVTLLAGGFGPPPAFEAIPRTNSVLVAAHDEQHDVIAALVASLDRVDQDMPPLRILQLRTADAANLARALNEQYARRPVEERNTRPVTISADVETNSLMIAAHPEVVPEIEAIVTELNLATRLNTEGREIRIFPLKVARAEELAKVIDDMYPEPPAPVDRRGRPMPQLREPREVVVRADPQTNSLIVDAPVQRLAGFEQLVEQLDRQKIAEETEVRTYRVVHAELEGIAGTLKQLATDGALSPEGGDRRTAISVTTEAVSRTLIVAGPIDVFERVEQVVNDLDAPRSGPATSLRFFKLEFARAESLAEMMREVLQSRIAEELPEAVARIESLLQVTADRKTNTLIVSAPTTMMPIAEMLIEQLDSGTASIGDPVVRVRPLTFADAADVTTALGTAIGELTSPVTGERMQVKLIASGGSNALILVGLTQDLDEVETLIEPLDARPATDAIDAQTFALEYAEAGVIAPIVERLLTDQQETDPRIVMERIRRSRGQVTLTPNIRVEADERTNSLIVSGPQQTVALAKTLIDQLDGADEKADVAFELFTPVNAEPAALATTVRQVIESSRP